MSTTDLINHLRDVQSAIEAYGCEALKNHPAVVSIDDAIATEVAKQESLGDDKIALLRALEDLWIRVPEWRLCQMIVNVGSHADGRQLYYVDDGAMHYTLRRWASRFREEPSTERDDG